MKKDIISNIITEIITVKTGLFLLKITQIKALTINSKIKVFFLPILPSSLKYKYRAKGLI